MNGTSALDGKPLSGINHLRQSIRDLLTTPLGSRVATRTYGSRLFNLIDAPTNRATLADIYAATAEALAGINPRTGQHWEPRFRLQQVIATSAEPGRVDLNLIGEYLPSGQVITLDGITVT
jgi:uncharacterized protein